METDLKNFVISRGPDIQTSFRDIFIRQLGMKMIFNSHFENKGKRYSQIVGASHQVQHLQNETILNCIEKCTERPYVFMIYSDPLERSVYAYLQEKFERVVIQSSRNVVTDSNANDNETQINEIHTQINEIRTQIKINSSELWKTLHLRALCHPENESDYVFLQQWESNVRNSCNVCFKTWIEWRNENPPKFGKDEYFKWSVDAHNAINKKLKRGKLSRIKAKWIWEKESQKIQENPRNLLQNNTKSLQFNILDIVGDNYSNYREEIQEDFNNFIQKRIEKNSLVFAPENNNHLYTNPFDYLEYLGVDLFSQPFNENGGNIHYSDKIIAVIGRYDKLDAFEKDMKSIFNMDITFQKYTLCPPLYQWMLNEIIIDISVFSSDSEIYQSRKKYMDYFYGENNYRQI